MRVKRISLKIGRIRILIRRPFIQHLSTSVSCFLGKFHIYSDILKKHHILFHFYIYIIAFSIIQFEEYEKFINLSLVLIHLTIALIAKFKSMLDILFADHKETLLIRFVFMSRRVINISISYIEEFTHNLVKLELFS